jgi:hypothetical protein
MKNCASALMLGQSPNLFSERLEATSLIARRSLKQCGQKMRLPRPAWISRNDR